MNEQKNTQVLNLAYLLRDAEQAHAHHIESEKLTKDSDAIKAENASWYYWYAAYMAERLDSMSGFVRRDYPDILGPIAATQSESWREAPGEMDELCQHYIDFSTTFDDDELKIIVNRILILTGADGASLHPVTGYWQGTQERAYRLSFIGESTTVERIAKYLRAALFQDVVLLSSSNARVIAIDRAGEHPAKGCKIETTPPPTQTYYPTGD